ncbi:hypothetical protein [Poseidonibacter ostreae]|jgi:hypothetical protein|uniref:Lipoprotein n=1 Tax=Poseidonibacter ostreae TaxID=2654171 RepID=A0A6L4WNQ2_9BACT|nr:hypothetical protein [Poseidonibacter ostreae]KAB7885223.1 hypothetical protein GBG19_14525 [Poseidonibacter ostreae]KAB7892428.1 hypothetical protein GBG18_03075 [Poseidonibacter ostreae]
MKVKYLSPLILSILFVGCTKEPIATVQATDYALSCKALNKEINNMKEQYSDAKGVNTAKNIVGGIMTLGLYSSNNENEIMLRERAKSLQLIYAIKQAKGECKELSSEDLKPENKIITIAKESKEIIIESAKATKETISETSKIISE